MIAVRRWDQSVMLLCLPPWDGVHVQVFFTGMCFYSLAAVKGLWRPTGMELVLQYETWEPGV